MTYPGFWCQPHALPTDLPGYEHGVAAVQCRYNAHRDSSSHRLLAISPPLLTRCPLCCKLNGAAMVDETSQKSGNMQGSNCRLAWHLQARFVNMMVALKTSVAEQGLGKVSICTMVGCTSEVVLLVKIQIRPLSMCSPTAY